MPKKDLLNILASETKMKILNELAKGRITPTDLSKRLNKGKSTIVEHLQELEKFGLVTKDEMPGRKWVFYSLTKEGYRVLEGRPKLYQLILPSSIMSLIVGVFLFYRNIAYRFSSISTERVYIARKIETATSIVPYIFIFLGVIGIIVYFLKVRKHG